ncbi:MAG: hypothetical protein ACC652_13735, partial [Acidimicrobiales bacterium]
DLVEGAVQGEQPLPPALVEGAASLHDFIRFDVSVADLLEVELAVRSQDTRSRLFTWSNGYELIVESVPGAEQSQLTGVITPADTPEILVRCLEGDVSRIALEAGTFEWVGAGRTLRLELFDGSCVTPWFRI